MSTIKFNFFWIFWKFILKMQFFFFHSLVALRRSHFQCGKCEGRRSQSSEARTPSLALPPRWARKGVLHLWCVTRLTFVCMLRYSEWDAVPIWVPGFFGTYSGMVYWAGFRTLQYLQWNVILIWFPNSSIFIMSRYSNPSSGLFDIYAETLRRYSYTPTIPGQDAPRPLPSLFGFYLFSCRLEVSARGRGYRFGLLRRRGDTT